MLVTVVTADHICPPASSQQVDDCYSQEGDRQLMKQDVKAAAKVFDKDEQMKKFPQHEQTRTCTWTRRVGESPSDRPLGGSAFGKMVLQVRL